MQMRWWYNQSINGDVNSEDKEMKTKACAVFIAIIMLFSFVCPAENGYVTISDPYYTDGENVYDLTGLSANLSYAKAGHVFELILRAITSYSQTAAGIEIENETVSLYADGFMNRYTMSEDDLIMLLMEATDGSMDVSSLISGLTHENVSELNTETEKMSSLISDIYAKVYGDGSQLANAKKATVDTFLHKGMSAFVVPVDQSAEAVDALISELLGQIDTQVGVSEEIFVLLTGRSDVSGMTALSLYEEKVKPIGLNIKGNAYYGENEIFIEWNLCAGEEVLLPVFVEVTNTDTPSLYVNVNFDDGYGGKIVVYATIESSADGLNDYLEIGVLEDERTTALVTYQVYQNDGMPVKDFYLGLANGNELYNFSFVSMTDSETARNLHVSAYLDGMEIQLSYNGTISSDYGDRNEQGVLQLATNFGIHAKANVGFGTGSGSPVEFIPDELPEKDIAAMNDEESQTMMAEFSNLLNTLSVSLVMGVPGFAQLVGMDDAQG